MTQKGLLVLMIVLTIFSVACSEEDTEAPRVVDTFPPNGSQDVDPSIDEISVTFNEEMMDQNWSWAYTNKIDFPEMTGQPYYVESYTRNVLPVKLEPGREYWIWLNSPKFKNFKDKSGNHLIPFEFTFKTK